MNQEKLEKYELQGSFHTLTVKTTGLIENGNKEFREVIKSNSNTDGETTKDDEIFRPCYLPESQKSEPCYKARHALPKYWFVSNYGTMITAQNGRVELFVGQISSSNRLQACFNYKGDRYVLARETIVAMVFNESVQCSDCARELIEKKGVKAFSRGGYSTSVVLHHSKGYLQPVRLMDVYQIMENVPINCALDRIELLTAMEHNYVHHPRVLDVQTKTIAI